ncbi:MAG: hypothetical protein H0V81_11040 [Solirubrobacterales bacterium]|nr:hypothetical protein [Solirubrobacterales bacterium]
MAAYYARGKQGGLDNQYLGAAWGLALLAACAWRVVQSTTQGRIGAVAVMASVAAAFAFGTITDRERFRLDPLRYRPAEVPADLRA